MNQPILLYRSGSVYANETAAWAALDAVTHKKGQPIVAFYTLSSPVSGHHGSSTIGAIFAIGIGDGVGQYKACTSHDDMLIVAQSLNAHITQFNQMFEYDANHNAIKAKLDFYTTDGKSISAGGIGSGSSASLGALYQLVDVMANSSNTGVEGAVEGSVLAYDATAGKWKAISQSEILPDMSGYYTKDETDSAINTAKSNLQGQVDTLKALIPATASADNQLADKDFVNSSIATATAEFKGSFTSLDELKATSGNLNDYAFYLHNDSVGNSIVDRYKWTTAGWLYEYTLNNSSFTAEQWAALNSAITATLVNSYNSHLTNSTIHITAAERTAWNNKWDYNEETIKAVKVNAALNADTLNGYYETGFYRAAKNGIPSGDLAKLEAGSYYNSSNLGDINPLPHTYSSLFVLGKSYYSQQLCVTYNATRAWLRGVINATTITVSDWHELAFTDSNVASATKLQTPRTIWGKPFDGSANVDGDLKDVGNITASGKATIQGDIVCGGEVVAIIGDGTPVGVTDYSALTGKPSINGVTLVSGNNTLAALGIQAAGDYATNSGVATLLANYADKTFVSNNYVGKSAFNNHTGDSDIHITSTERTAWNNKWDYNEATIKAVKVTSASSADSVAWSGIKDKPTTFTPSSHQHEKITHTLWGYYNAISDTTSPIDICTNFNIGIDNDQALFIGIVQNATGERYQSLFWTGYGAAGLVELSKSYGNDGRLKYRVSEGWSDNGAHWAAAGYRELANFEDLTWTNIKSKPTTIAGYGITDALTTSNYNSYAPTLTGTGASGTWGISISGNAATATKLQTPRTIWGQSFDGSGDVSGKPRFIYATADSSTINENNAAIVLGAGNNTAAYYKCGISFNALAYYAGDENNNHAHHSHAWIGLGPYISRDNSELHPLVFATNSSTTTNAALTERMRILPNGNILIGTTTDNGSRMMIWSSVSSSARPSLGNLKGDIVSIGYSGYYGVHLWNEGSGNGFVQVGRSDGNATAYHLILQPLGGYVGINTDSPKYKLDVNGTGHYSGDLIVDGEVSALVA